MRDASPPSRLPEDGRHHGASDGHGPSIPSRATTAPRHLAPRGRRGGDEHDEAEGSHRPRPYRTVLEWVAVVASGVLIALVAQAVLVQAFWIPSPSMAPTLERGDRVLVNKLAYRSHEVHRGDVIVFERPPGASPGDDDIKDLIKRVVAVEGDTVESYQGAVYVNGERIDEPYLVDGTPTDDLPRREIPEGHVFVMGDNRTNSEDSRVFGPVDEDTIVGRAFVKVLPPADAGWL
ncbi:MAG TPA: signal peptidase I [Acidimicrobiales bacterium]|nr:signal peptidase I [Acidimicrobiales bacterium]